MVPNDPENNSSSKYYEIDQIHDIKIPHKNDLQPLFHISAYSFVKRFDDFQNLELHTKILTE